VERQRLFFANPAHKLEATIGSAVQKAGTNVVIVDLRARGHVSPPRWVAPVHKPAKPGHSAEIEEANADCAICISALRGAGDSGKGGVTFLPCMHGFHSLCVAKWLRQKDAMRVCPSCMMEVDPSSLDLPDVPKERKQPKEKKGNRTSASNGRSRSPARSGANRNRSRSLSPGRELFSAMPHCGAGRHDLEKKRFARQCNRECSACEQSCGRGSSVKYTWRCGRCGGDFCHVCARGMNLQRRRP